MDYLKFKSGTDIRGVASEGVEGEHINLTDYAVKSMTGGFLLWLEKYLNMSADKMKISVGHDSRISAHRIKNAVVEVLMMAGVHVIDCGLSSTPAMFMTTIELSCNAAIQLTASHHPFNRNGLKFFTKNGGLEGSDITEILQYANEGKMPKEADGGFEENVDFMTRYAEILRNKIIDGTGEERPLEGFKIVVDAGNGAGGFYATKVLKPLGADITGSQFLEPDGMFPNHIPNPENEVAMQSVSKATVENHADLGVIFDTDVDRASCVDSHGFEINRNRIVALAASLALENCKGGTVVTDSVTSSGLKTFIEKDLGGHHYRYRRGYKNVIDRAIELNDQGIKTPLAIETSGHAAFEENYFLDDGAYLITKIIIKAALLNKQGKTVDELIKSLKEPAEAREYRFKINCDDFKSYGEKVINELEKYSNEQGWAVADDNREGVRVSLLNGWFLLRLSVHDPIMPLNIESDEQGGVDKIRLELKKFLQGCEKLDISPIE